MISTKINLFMMETDIIQKPVHWFAEQLKFAYYLKGNLEMRPYSQIPQETKNAYSQQVKFLFKADKKGRSSNIFGHSSSIDVVNFEQVF